MIKFKNLIMRYIHFVFALFITQLFASCSQSSYKIIGKVNMISNRNVNPNLNYKQLTTYSGSSDSELKRSNAQSIEEAIDYRVRLVPGGEFLMNVKIYKINDIYFGVQGDVWGLDNGTNQISFKGFNIGDKVTWKRSGKYITGVLKAFINDEKVLVLVDNENKTLELSYRNIILFKNEIESKIALNESNINLKYKINQKVSWTEFNKIKFGIIQDFTEQNKKVIIKYLNEIGKEKIKYKYLDDIFMANDLDYDAYNSKTVNLIKNHTFKKGDIIKWSKSSDLYLTGEVVEFFEDEMLVAIKYRNEKNLEKIIKLDAFKVNKN